MITKHQKDYYNILDLYFGDIYNYLERKQISFEDLPSKEFGKFISVFTQCSLVPFFDDIINFWAKNSDKINQDIQSLKTSKIVYSGEIAPKRPDEIVQRSVLYTDTIILPDPLLELTTYSVMYNKYALTSKAFLRATKLLKLKEIALANIETPIFLVCPSFNFKIKEIELEKNKGIGNIVQAEPDYGYSNDLNIIDILNFSQELFQKKFNSIIDLNEYISKMKNISQIIDAIKKPEILIMNEPQDIGKKFEEKFLNRLNYENTLKSDFNEYVNLKLYNTSNIQFSSFLGIFGGPLICSNRALMRSKQYSASPIFDNSHSWYYFKWKLNNDMNNYKEVFNKEERVNIRIINTLQKKPFKWLANIPLDKIIELRENDDLKAFRNNLFLNVASIEEGTGLELNNTFRIVKKKINEEIERYNREYQKMEVEYSKRYNLDISLYSITGVLSILTSFFPPIAWLLGPIGGGTIIDFARTLKGHRDEIKNMNQRPAAILMEAYQKQSVNH